MSSATATNRVTSSCRMGINEPHRHKAVAGAWRLPPGQALGLAPRRPAVLRVRRGRVWATLGVPEVQVPGELGDRFLDAGDCLRVPAGARLVLEVVARPGEGAAAAQFDWSDAAASAEAARFERDVLAPWHELGAASAQAARATGRLLRGLLVYGEGRVLAWRRARLAPGCR